MSFGIGTFSTEEGGAFAGLVVDEHVIDVRPALGDGVTVLSLLGDWDSSFARLQELAGDGGGTPLGELEVLPPIHPAGAYLCAGANYRKHVIEMRAAVAANQGKDPEKAAADAAVEMDTRAASGHPFVWVGWPGAVCGAYDDVILPDDGSEQHDWELELAVVIGKFARCISKEQAMDHVAGYTILNDISSRDRMWRNDVRFSDFLSTKLRPTFKPIGPWITPAEFVENPLDLHMTLKVDGEVMQDESTSDLVFKIDRLIEYISAITDLRPGDIIATGSPAGNAQHHGNRYLKPGDVMEGTIEGLGTQRNAFVAASESPKGPPLAPVFKLRDV